MIAVLIVALPIVRSGIEKNLEYWGGGVESLANMLEHGWGEFLATNAIVVSLGVLVVSLSYLALFVTFHHLYLGQYLPANITSLAAPPFMLFIFFMISDPKTSPKIWWHQVLFALAVVVMEGMFKLNKIPNGVLWSLLITCFFYNAVIPMMRDLFTQRDELVLN